jgi:hypothetical protein
MNGSGISPGFSTIAAVHHLCFAIRGGRLSRSPEKTTSNSPLDALAIVGQPIYRSGCLQIAFVEMMVAILLLCNDLSSDFADMAPRKSRTLMTRFQMYVQDGLHLELDTVVGRGGPFAADTRIVSHIS